MSELGRRAGGPGAAVQPADRDIPMRHIRLPEAVRRLEAAAERIVTRHRGGRMVWRVWGSGSPVILLHGAFGSWTHWVRTIPSLAAQRRVIAPDMPGFGDSDMPASDELLEEIPQALSDGLAAVLADARAFDLVAFSFGSVMGGAWAAQVAQREPQFSVDRLILVAPAGLGLNVPDFASVARLRPGMTQAEIEEVHRHNLSVMMFARSSTIDDATIRLQIVNTSRARVRGRRYSRSDALAKAARQIRTRGLVAVWGGKDAYAMRDQHAYEDRVARLAPDIRIHRIAGGGHWVQYECADAFNSFLTAAFSEAG